LTNRLFLSFSKNKSGQKNKEHFSFEKKKKKI